MSSIYLGMEFFSDLTRSTIFLIFSFVIAFPSSPPSPFGGSGLPIWRLLCIKILIEWLLVERYSWKKL